MKMSKVKVAFLLGVISFLVVMVVGETFSEKATIFFILMAAYFFICQFFLSRGNPDAYRNDWRIMLALDSVLVLGMFIAFLVEKRKVFLTQGFGFLLVCLASTFAGMVAASIAARRRGRQKFS